MTMLMNVQTGVKLIFVFLILHAGCISSQAQKTTLVLDSATLNAGSKKKDSTVSKAFRPAKIAATRSAILPGLGQIYNKKYWKLPIVYGALTTTGFFFRYNYKNYKDLKQAYIGKYNARVFHDSTEYRKIKPNLVPLSEESLRFQRDQFRRDMDYSVLIFALLWGLNVMDAAVDAHLKSFDVSPDLSLKIKPGHSQMAGTNGLSLLLTIGK
jgi:hypothetical protein